MKHGGIPRGGSHRSRDREGAVVAYPNNRSLPVAAPVTPPARASASGPAPAVYSSPHVGRPPRPALRLSSPRQAQVLHRRRGDHSGPWNRRQHRAVLHRQRRPAAPRPGRQRPRASTGSPSLRTSTDASSPTRFNETLQDDDHFNGLLGAFPAAVNVRFDANPAHRTWCELVTGSYFSTLGIEPYLGRLITPEDDRVRLGSPVVVVSYSYWQSRLGGDPDALGRSLEIKTVQPSLSSASPRLVSADSSRAIRAICSCLCK